MANHKKNKERMVIKIGSSSLTNKNGELHLEKIKGYVRGMAELAMEGNEIILVTSGAVAAGFRSLGFPARPKHIEGKQAAAAVGQGLLMWEYNQEFLKYNLHTAQILITRQDFSKRNQYINAYNTLNVLLKRNIVPIINENDTVSIEELTFGDNDMLSALVAGLVHADRLIIITDTDGVYDKDPREHRNATKLKQINEITPELLESTSSNGSNVGTGGMRSKILSAKMAMSLGVHVYIGSFYGKDTLRHIISNKGTGTYFRDENLSTLKAKKQWIAFHAITTGDLTIDAGAVAALMEHGRSLLPAGILKTSGHFSTGDVVEVHDFNGKLLGRGIINYSSTELKEMLYTETKENERIQNHKEVIHRDNWFYIAESQKRGEKDFYERSIIKG